MRRQAGAVVAADLEPGWPHRGEPWALVVLYTDAVASFLTFQPQRAGVPPNLIAGEST